LNAARLLLVVESVVTVIRRIVAKERVDAAEMVGVI
jgi:hypothetical protein